ADARGAAGALHGRRDLRVAARGVGDVRRRAGAGLVGPPPGNDLAVVLLADRRTEGDQRDPVGAALEVSHHAGTDPEDVPLPELVHLVIELDPARAFGDHVDLLLLGVRMSEGLANTGREPLDADTADLAGEMPL